MKTCEAFSILKQAAGEWLDDKAATLGAALAYYTVFSLAPMLVIAVGISGFVFGREAAQVQILSELRSLVGEQGGEALQEMVQNAAAQPWNGVLSTVVGVVTLIIGASGVFGQMQTSLNTMWGVEAKPGRGIRGLVKDRILSFGFTLVAGFLLLVSLILTALVAAFGKWLNGMLPLGESIALASEFVLSLSVVTLLFAMIFKYLPDVLIAWRDVWIGAFLTAVLFTIGKLALGFYLGRSSLASSYGAAGSLIVLLFWVYYSAQIVLFGAEFTQVYANRCGSHVEPKTYAQRVPPASGPQA